MKKYVAILLGVLFVLSFAASAFAIHAEIPSETQAVVAKGATQITIDGEIRTRGWWKKNVNGNLAPDKADSAANYDERIRLSVDAKVAPGVEGFVQLESGSGDNDLYTWGNFNSKPTSLSVLQAWILAGFGPGGVKIGHMPLALGEKLFFDHTKFGDDAIVLFAAPTKGLEMAALTVKFAEGSKTYNNDDLDGYVGLVTYDMGDHKFGVNYTYLNQSMSRFKHQNIGVHANGTVAGLGYKADAEMNLGSVGDGDSQTDYRGMAFMAALNYKLDPVNIKAGFGYGSGDDKADKKDKQFENYLGADQHYTLVYDYSVVTAAVDGNGNHNRYTGLSNTTYVTLGVDVAPMKDLTANLDLYMLRASKTPDGVSKNIGWETDAGVGYQIAKNLKYKFDIGFLFAGDFYKDSGLSSDKKTAAVVRHALTLSF